MDLSKGEDSGNNNAIFNFNNWAAKVGLWSRYLLYVTTREESVRGRSYSSVQQSAEALIVLLEDIDSAGIVKKVNLKKDRDSELKIADKISNVKSATDDGDHSSSSRNDGTPARAKHRLVLPDPGGPWRR
jgi:hypothetical protein